MSFEAPKVILMISVLVLEAYIWFESCQIRITSTSMSSGFSILGTYIRTSDGRIFAIRAANKPNMSDENAAIPHKG